MAEQREVGVALVGGYTLGHKVNTSAVHTGYLPADWCISMSKTMY